MSEKFKAPVLASEFYSKKFPAISLITIREILESRKELEEINKNSFCGLCAKPLTEEEKETLDPNHYYTTCYEHREAGKVFQWKAARAKAGITGEVDTSKYFLP